MAPSRSSPPKPTFSSRKSVVVLGLEDVLVPGKICPDLDMKGVHRFLRHLQKYAREKGIQVYLITGYTEAVCRQKLNKFGLEKYFPREKVFAVHSGYLNQMQPIDRAIYDKRCAEDAFCKDEYYRQVELQALMKREGFTPTQIVLVGHDYWFDGFYTRRFSQVDVAFIENGLSVRGKPTSERIGGVWYIRKGFPDLKKIIEGKTKAPNYASLDTWVGINLTEELLGGKGFPTLKRIIIERKKGKSGEDSFQVT